MIKQDKLVAQLTKLYPAISFVSGASHHWSPTDKTVYYTENQQKDTSTWALLHETSHGLLGHSTYKSDFELVLLEVEAWEHAKILANKLEIKLDDSFDEHQEDCLDSYRDWQHKRSLCPQCNLSGIQIAQKQYKCIFCAKSWNVSAARFCRPYRRRA